MGFYSPTWVRKLVKEDHAYIAEYLKKSDNNFRSYIDSNTPFVLWLDIGLIRERILNKSSAFIQELAKVVSDSEQRDLTKVIIDILDKAYIATINAYASNPAYLKITDQQLETMLSSLSNAEFGSVKKTIQSTFKRTMVVTNVTKKNKSVMLILPKFTTLEFGSIFKAELSKLVEKSKLLNSSQPVAIGGFFAALGTGTAESEKTRLLDFVSGNFTKLQNIGHVEVDVVSEVDRKVYRSQNSPRLLQALITLPNDIKSFERLQLKFSKETGQAATRIKVRKRFSGSKMVFEMLVTNGLAVGIPETQEDNLYKAALEKKFSIGSNLTAALRKDIGILANLETSKSIDQYLKAFTLNSLKGGKPYKAYSKDTEINVVTKIVRQKVKADLNRKSSSASTPIAANKGSKRTAPTTNLASLQLLLNSQLVDQVKRNMGSGSRKDVLNLRSGRLAESARVERLSESREGMITAFYTYMKNPYATFSAGGAQESPKSRDPKALVSRSLREIAANEAITRFRAVLV